MTKITEDLIVCNRKIETKEMYGMVTKNDQKVYLSQKSALGLLILTGDCTLHATTRNLMLKLSGRSRKCSYSAAIVRIIFDWFRVNRSTHSIISIFHWVVFSSVQVIAILLVCVAWLFQFIPTSLYFRTRKTIQNTINITFHIIQARINILNS